MKTAQDIITDFQGLTQDQQKEVIHFVNSTIQQDEYSEEITNQLLQAKKDAEQDINISPIYKTKEEALEHLNRLPYNTQSK